MFNEMQFTSAEAEILERCYSALDEEQIAECYCEAAEIADAELQRDEAAELLVPLLARIMVRSVRAAI